MGRRHEKFPSLNVRKLCHLVLVGARLRQGEGLGSEGGKVIGRSSVAYNRNFDINVERAELR